MTQVKDTPAPSPVEGIKAASNGLRGTIIQTIASGIDHFEEGDKQLLKFHGTYQQEDRDARKSRSAEGLAGKAYSFMIRARIPAGMLSLGVLIHINGWPLTTLRGSMPTKRFA